MTDYTEADLERAVKWLESDLDIEWQPHHYIQGDSGDRTLADLATLIASVRAEGRRAGLEEAAVVACEVHRGLSEKGFETPAGGAWDVWQAIRALIADKPAGGEIEDEPTRLRAENERLREALRFSQDVVDALRDTSPDAHSDYWDTYDAAVRAALKPAGQEGNDG